MSSPSADLKSRDFSKILLIKLSAVGDVVHTIPVLNKLRRRYPSAQIDWLVTPAIAELLRHNPAITNVIEFARDDWSIALDADAVCQLRAACAASLRADGYDLVVDMHGQFRTALFVLATGAPVRIGFDRPRGKRLVSFDREPFPPQARKHAWQGAREGSWLAYTHHIPVPTLDVHAVDRYLSVGPMLGLDGRPARFLVSHSSKQRARASSACCAGTASPGRLCSPWRRARSGKPNIGAAASLPKWRGISCGKDFAVTLDGQSPRARASARRWRGSPRVRSISPATPH